MFDSALWGLVQGLTEFLPISSSGHLVLVPALLGREGPTLATSAVLHLGTLLSLLVYFRREVAAVLRLTDDGRRLLRWLAIGTVPAAVLGLTLESGFEWINDRPRLVAVALFVTGVVLLATNRLARGQRSVPHTTDRDAILIGVSQAAALIPGISRSGATIATGLTRRYDPRESARFAFLLAIPAIGGAGLLQFVELARGPEGIAVSTWVGLAVAAVSGYAAIAWLIRLIGRAGLTPFGIYCLVAATVAFFLV